MPAVIDISNSGTPKKSTGKPQPPTGPKPGLLIGLGIGALLAVLFLVWFFVLRGGNHSGEITPYDTSHTRNLGAPAGGAGGGTGTSTPNVPRGLPAEGG